MDNRDSKMMFNRPIIIAVIIVLSVMFVVSCNTNPVVEEPEESSSEVSETETVDQESEELEIEEAVEHEVAVIVSGTFRTDVGMGSLEKLFPDAKGDVSFSFEEAIDAFSKYDYERSGSYITLEDGAKASIFNIDFGDGINQEALAEPSVTERIIEKWSKGKILNYSLGYDGYFSVTESVGSELNVIIEPIEEIALNGTVVSWKIVGFED